MIYTGLPQRSHPKWVRLGITSLEGYARHSNCVEGNTMPYALPKSDIVACWQAQTTNVFRFHFRSPAIISHQTTLRNCDDLVQEFFIRMSPLETRIGQYWLQLPAIFDPRDLPALWQFLDMFPNSFTYGVEVRHPEFFAEGEAEQLFGRGLCERGVNRVILDSRPVHAAIPDTEAIHDAQRKKLKVSVHAVVTVNHLVVRFIDSGSMVQNSELFAVWLTKPSLWQRTMMPYPFLHTPDIAQAPELIDTLWVDLRGALPEIRSVPSIPQQPSLF